MHRRYFEFVDSALRSGDSLYQGNYLVEHEDYPKCILRIINLAKYPPIDSSTYSLTYDVIDGMGERYYYQIAIVKVSENKAVPKEDLHELVEYCWDWWLSHYLQE